MNMKFTKYLLLCFFLFASCSGKKPVKDSIRNYPPFKLIIDFSQKIKPKTNLVLTAYGINHNLPKNYQYKNGIANFTASYYLNKTKNDEISLKDARNLLVFLTENFLQDINSNGEIRKDLDVYPFVSDLLDITIHFKDENKIDLGQGVAIVYFAKGKIKYKGYKIEEYRSRYPAVGKQFTIHEETYAEALEIVKNKGSFCARLAPKVQPESPRIVLENSQIQKSIDYEVKTLSNLAQKIIAKKKPNLKQLHVTSDDADYVFKEALKQLSPEYRNTIVVITTGATSLIENDLACVVYNVSGDKDLASKIFNGGKGGIEAAKEWANVEIIPQKEGEIFDFKQPECQNEISLIINNKVAKNYEID